MRPIFWFSVLDDQSVYLGPRVVDAKSVEYGKHGTRTEQGVRFNYRDGDAIDLSEMDNPSKISFHQSGIVDAPSTRSFLGPNRIGEGQLLAHLLFQHPSQFQTITSVRKRDVVLKINIDDDTPLIGRIVKFEDRSYEPVRIESSDLQLDLVFGYPETTEKPRFTLLLTLYAGQRSPWPPKSYIVWPVKSP